jgi:hypothetical protein
LRNEPLKGVSELWADFKQAADQTNEREAILDLRAQDVPDEILRELLRRYRTNDPPPQPVAEDMGFTGSMDDLARQLFREDTVKSSYQEPVYFPPTAEPAHEGEIQVVVDDTPTVVASDPEPTPAPEMTNTPPGAEPIHVTSAVPTTQPSSSDEASAALPDVQEGRNCFEDNPIVDGQDAEYLRAVVKEVFLETDSDRRYFSTICPIVAHRRDIMRTRGIDLQAFVQAEVNRLRAEMGLDAPQTQTQRPHSNDPHPEGDRLYPADREDMLAGYIDDRPGKHLKREEMQKHFGFSKDQTQRALSQLKKNKRIGYQEVNEREPNPQNPGKYRFRKDAVYFSLKKQQPEETFPIMINNLEELKAFLDRYKNL